MVFVAHKRTQHNFIFPFFFDMSLSHQDWQTVTWSKPSTKPTGPVRPKSKGSDEARQLHKIENEQVKILTVTRIMGQQIQAARAKKTWTQEDLAREASIPVAVIKQYEKGEGKYDRRYLDPICRKLGIRLHKPKVEKQEFDGEAQ